MVTSDPPTEPPAEAQARKLPKREHMYGCPCCFDAYIPVEDRFKCEEVDEDPLKGRRTRQRG